MNQGQNLVFWMTLWTTNSFAHEPHRLLVHVGYVCWVNSRSVYHSSTYNEMRLVPGLAGAFSNSLASRGVKVKCTIFSGSSSTPSVADAPPERKYCLSYWNSFNSFYLQRVPLARAPGYIEISLHQKSLAARLTWAIITGTYLPGAISFVSFYSLLGFVYIGTKAKVKATLLPNELIENPIWWSHCTTRKNIIRVLFRSV